jgi:uncharacterized protein (DUF885 family)
MRPLCLFLLFTAGVAAADPAPAPAGDVERRFRGLLDEAWETQLKEHPGFATLVGDPRYNDRLDDDSPEAIARRKAYARDLHARLLALEPAALPAPARLDYDLFRRQLEEEIAGQRFCEECLPLNQMSGAYRELTDLAEVAPRARVKDLEDFLKRMEAYPTLVDQHIALMRTGLARGITPPRVTLREVGRVIAAQIVEEPATHPIYPLLYASPPATVPPKEARRLQKAARKAIAERVVPALDKLRRFVVEEYEPKARASIGLSDLPEGPAWYAHRVRASTTTDLSPDRIHQIGLGEVKRIRAEMEAVMRKTGHTGDLASFFQHLRTDPRFFFEDKEALLTAYRDIAKRIDPGLPRLFGTLPRLTYGVRPVPPYLERTQTTAYYNPGSPEGGRPGWFYANTFDLKSRPKWEMEALTLHEAVPGHHLQIALAQELGELPPFRRHAHFTAFVEGWGLYAESLGGELGLYQDPYARFGQLTYEMWRAIRLVVDTGMHGRGWTREQAIEFFKRNAGKSEHDIVVEVDRYIVWPGQALGYKIGELKLKELRAFAAAQLGERFDPRAFHDVVLGAGALPLQVLEERVRAWVFLQKKNK